MKVGIVHTSYTKRGGEDIVVEQELKFLKSHQVETCLLSFQNPVNRKKQVLGLLGAAFNFHSWKRMNKWIKEERPDIIHIHNWHFAASPAIIKAAKKRGVPVVHTLHNFRLVCPSALLLHNNKLFLKSLRANFPWAAVFNRVYHNSFLQTFLLSFTVWAHKISGTWKSIDRYIALTEHAKNIFLSSHLRLKEDQIVIKPNFIDHVPAKNERRDKNFLFVGRLSEEKGLDLLLEAFKGSGYGLRIIGDGPLLPLVQKYAEENPSIQYIGFQNRDVILQELRQCTALVFSSVWYEGNPLVIMESFACGTPVIAPRFGAMETMVKDGYNGLHFDPCNAPDLRQKLQQWAALAEEDKTGFRHNARLTYSQNYTPDRNIEQLLFIYKSVINEKGRFTKHFC